MTISRATFLLAPAALLTASRAASARAQDAYAAPDLLVTTEWLTKEAAKDGAAGNVRVVDVRPAAAYAEGHLPGAVNVPEGPLRDPADKETYLPSPEAYAKLAGAMGLTPETRVVAYDDQGGKSAARLWYVLQAYGHAKASLLDGGFRKWKREARPVSQETSAVTPTVVTPRLTPTLTCPSAELLARKPDVIVLDTRSPEEFWGDTTTPGAAKAGHIPKAYHVDWRENLTGDDLTFKPAADLRKLYAAKGITPDREIIVHCATGGRASVSLFALKLLGYPKVRVYYGSFTDYATRDAPVQK
jgi:thiosulfate/3-mercaptopyruvate sulfurtransferase